MKKKNAEARKKQRSKLNDRLAKRQKQLATKHKAELEEVAPEAAQLADQHSEERAALAAMQKSLTATQAELAAERAKHQAALDALAAKHDEELRMQQVCAIIMCHPIRLGSRPPPLLPLCSCRCSFWHRMGLTIWLLSCSTNLTPCGRSLTSSRNKHLRTFQVSLFFFSIVSDTRQSWRMRVVYYCMQLTMCSVRTVCSAAGFAGEEHSAATQAVLGEYQLSMDAATKKTKAEKAESKAALQARLEKKRKQMEAKAAIAVQKIAEADKK
jgi:hypothetical protein